MLNPKLTWKAALIVLLLGVAFLSANLFIAGTGHSNLANMFFVFAILCDVAFVIFAVLWAAGKAWTSETPPPGMPAPGRPMPGGGPGQKPTSLQLKRPTEPPPPRQP
jgi:hypothetical protein